MIWGILPAAGLGTRMGLPFAKELIPLLDGERVRPVCDFAFERLRLAGAEEIVMVVSPEKPELLRYQGVRFLSQEKATGLCAAIFLPRTWIGNTDTVLVALPDTVWFPVDALKVQSDGLSFIAFPVDDASQFDEVLDDGTVRVKQAPKRAGWVWGALAMTGRAYHLLAALWDTRRDIYFGDLANAFGGPKKVERTGTHYFDVGTPESWMVAQDFLRFTHNDKFLKPQVPKEFHYGSMAGQ